MTFATYITISRLLAAIAMLPIIYFRTEFGYRIAIGIFVYALISDIVDGFVARKFNQVTDFGTRLDPLVDKILIYSVLFCLGQLGAIMPGILFPMFIRDMIVDGLRNSAAESNNVLAANFWGKAKFGFQSLSIVSGLWFCASGRSEFLNVANVALLIALVVSVPGVVVIVSKFKKNSGTTDTDSGPRIAEHTLL